ncbi:hypothetical protein [Cupriavidus agavae]|uniref:Flagellin n=1 Tax=Cupriavidus agavae TaxID=1001822 RepID=A0A4Q7RHB4_9BURK|nr:hypothetical protein [Cupriavidus agavae]RZT31868.1 hypothetical protein EV147_4368 [Cupriavidus agavae]
MVQTTDSSAPRASGVPRRTVRAARPATAAMLLGAGLACTGHAFAETDVLAADAVGSASLAVPYAVELAAMPVSLELPSLGDGAPVAATAVATAVAELAGHAPAESFDPPDAGQTVAEAPAPVVPVNKATVARHQPAGDPVARAMTLATRDPEAPVAEARKGMAKWKPVAQARLEESRGGFDAGGLQIGFGIDRAVFVNGALAVSTSITIPDVRAITAAQAAQLQQALGQVTVAVSAANNAANAAVAAAQAAAAAAQGAAGQAAQAAGTAANGAVATAQGAAGAASTAASAAAAGATATAAGAAGMAQQAIANAGIVATNGLMTVVQNGAGNVANLGAAANMPGTVIQNNLNNQNIQSLMTLNASVNTLAAFRSQLANTALNSVIQRSAAMR